MNLINLREAPIVDKAKEGATLFALNTDGTVERISAENVGGGKVAIIKADLSSMMNPSAVSLMSRMTGKAVAADAGVETLADDSGSNEIPCTCDTMTFEEAKAILLAGEKLDAVVVIDMSAMAGSDYIMTVYPYMTGFLAQMPKTAEATNEEGIGIACMMNPSASITVTWTADGITMVMG